jgi:hypothetical protein
MDLRPLLTDHRDSIEEFSAAARAVEAAAWERRPAPDKWSPSQIAEHLRITYDVILRELRGGAGIRVRLPWWRRSLLRATVLRGIVRHGRFPGRAPAVREIRPGDGPYERAATLAALADLSQAFLREIEAHPDKRLSHAFFGRMAAPAGLRMLAAHNRHHAAQLAAPASTTASA